MCLCCLLHNGCLGGVGRFRTQRSSAHAAETVAVPVFVPAFRATDWHNVTYNYTVFWPGFPVTVGWSRRVLPANPTLGRDLGLAILDQLVAELADQIGLSRLQPDEFEAMKKTHPVSNDCA